MDTHIEGWMHLCMYACVTVSMYNTRTHAHVYSASVSVVHVCAHCVCHKVHLLDCLPTQLEWVQREGI